MANSPGSCTEHDCTHVRARGANVHSTARNFSESVIGALLGTLQPPMSVNRRFYYMQSAVSDHNLVSM